MGFPPNFKRREVRFRLQPEVLRPADPNATYPLSGTKPIRLRYQPKTVPLSTRGRLLCARTGKPVSLAEVRIEGEKTTTDSSGFFEISVGEGEDARRATAVFQHPDFEPKTNTVFLEPGAAEEATILLTPRPTSTMDADSGSQ